MCGDLFDLLKIHLGTHVPVTMKISEIIKQTPLRTFTIWPSITQFWLCNQNPTLSQRQIGIKYWHLPDFHSQPNCKVCPTSCPTSTCYCYIDILFLLDIWSERSVVYCHGFMKHRSQRWQPSRFLVNVANSCYQNVPLGNAPNFMDFYWNDWIVHVKFHRAMVNVTSSLINLCFIWCIFIKMQKLPPL